MESTRTGTSVIDGTYKLAAPAETYKAVIAALLEEGFVAREVGSSPDDSVPDGFHARLSAERDIVKDRSKRLLGKILVFSNILLVFFTLGLMVTGEERRFVLEWLLTIEVVAGGYGLMLLKNPADRRRTVLEFDFEMCANGLRVGLWQRTALMEGTEVLTWQKEPEDLNAASRIRDLLSDAERAEAYA